MGFSLLLPLSVAHIEQVLDNAIKIVMLHSRKNKWKILK